MKILKIDFKKIGLHKKHCNCFNEKKENLQSQGFQNVHNKRCHLKWDLLGKWKFWMFMYIVRHKMIFSIFLPVWIWLVCEKFLVGNCDAKRYAKLRPDWKIKKGCENPDELTRLWRRRCCFRQRRIQPCRRNPCGRQSRRWLGRG